MIKELHHLSMANNGAHSVKKFIATPARSPSNKIVLNGCLARIPACAASGGKCESIQILSF